MVLQYSILPITRRRSTINVFHATSCNMPIKTAQPQATIHAFSAFVPNIYHVMNPAMAATGPEAPKIGKRNTPQTHAIIHALSALLPRKNHTPNPTMAPTTKVIAIGVFVVAVLVVLGMLGRHVYNAYLPYMEGNGVFPYIAREHKHARRFFALRTTILCIFLAYTF